jgi:hypothetical protein
MKTVWAGLFAAATLIPALPGAAQERPTYDGLWREQTQTRACPATTTPDLILVQCKGELIIWYFTRANHPAHPGVIKRDIFQKDGAWYASEQGWSFGPDSTQVAFQKLLGQIKDLDRQMTEALQRDRAQAPRN